MATLIKLTYSVNLPHFVIPYKTMLFLTAEFRHLFG